MTGPIDSGRGQCVSFRTRFVEIIIFVAAVAWILSARSAEAAPDNPRWAEGRILVQPREGLTASQFDRTVRRAGGRAVRKIRGLKVHVVEVSSRAEEAVARALGRNPHIKFAELDRLVGPHQIVPNDPHYANAWHLPVIGAPHAWELALGDGVKVAVLDTGVDEFHLDLNANMVAGWNSVSGGTDTADVNGHGTQVAGVVAARSNNGLGVASVAWNARIMPVRVTNRSDGWAYFSDIANGLTWAADNGARVANISYDVSGSATVRNAAQYMKNAGGLAVVAAGNSGADPGHGSSTTLIAVSATTSSDTRASWSSFGSHVDVAAPGAGIWTTARGGGYSAPSGTSFSSPTTAGVVALIMAVNSTLSPDEVESVLKNSADDLGDPSWDSDYGAGRVNAAAAVALAADVSPGDSDPPAVSIASPTANSTVQGSVPVDVFATDNFGVNRVELRAAGNLVGTDTTAPYAFSWDSTRVSDGTTVLVARAFDAAGNQGSSSNVPVEVENSSGDGGDTLPPSVTITSPDNDTTVSGTVNLAAHASDDGHVSEVRIYVDGALKCAGSPNVSCAWNTRRVSAGSHTVSATAKDGAGNSATVSVSVTVTAKKRGKKGRK